MAVTPPRMMKAPPLNDTPPFWEAVTSDRLAALCGVPAAPPGALDLAPGLQLALVSVAGVTAPRVAGWGWVRPPFAVVLVGAAGAVLANLTHLPTGLRVACFPDTSDAIRGADLLAPLADWANLDESAGNHLPVPQTLEAAGYAAHTLIGAGPPARLYVREGALQ